MPGGKRRPQVSPRPRRSGRKTFHPSCRLAGNGETGFPLWPPLVGGEKPFAPPAARWETGKPGFPYGPHWSGAKKPFAPPAAWRETETPGFSTPLPFSAKARIIRLNGALAACTLPGGKRGNRVSPCPCLWRATASLLITTPRAPPGSRGMWRCEGHVHLHASSSFLSSLIGTQSERLSSARATAPTVTLSGPRIEATTGRGRVNWGAIKSLSRDPMA